MFEVKGIWLQREGDYAVVIMETGGKQIELIREPLDCPFSHYVHTGGIQRAIDEANK
jgi:hypothetical protein